MVCPFHGWSFNLDGTLRSVAQPRSLPDLDPVKHGLVPLEFEIWHGFVFVRFEPGPQSSVEELMARHEAEISLYKANDAIPTDRGFWTQHIDANWKCVRDVDNEGYHVPMAHPGLQDLYGHNYFDENWIDGTNRSFGAFTEREGRLWSTSHYHRILPDMEHLPESHRRVWLYIGIFPNQVLYFYPEGLGFYQELPEDTIKTSIRSCAYGLPMPEDADEVFKRRIAAARYLAARIDNDTVEEDIQLTIWSNEASRSSGFQGFILSDLEYGVKGHHDQLRELMPVLNLSEPPKAGTLRSVDSELLAERGSGQ
jgi:phenylpropionate dioxygenase-like ring-hydroxylating dioxygenase large terminal subunit